MTYLDKDWRVTFFTNATPDGVDPMVHEHRIWVNVSGGGDPGDVFDDFSVVSRNLTTQSLQEFVDDYVLLIQPLYSDTSSVLTAELWAAEPNTNDFTFYSSYDIGVDGTAITGDIACMQGTLTFRPQLGGWGKLVFMEPVVNTVLRVPFPTSVASVDTIAGFTINANSPIIHRTKGFYISKIAYSGNINDELEKARYR